MSSVERIDRAMADAMRAKDRGRLSTLRLLKAALVNRSIERGQALDEAKLQQVVTTLVKQRRESIEQFNRGGRPELAAKEAAEITILEEYLPPAMDAAELDRIVSLAIKEADATSVKDLGRVMKLAMAKLAGQFVDGRAVNELARRKLG